MTLAVRAVFWVVAYVGAVLSPLVFAVIGGSQPDHDFWTNFSVALGFTGLAMMGLEFVLVARFRAVAAPFGQDALLQFHRQIGYAGLAFILVHFAISAHWDEVTPAKALAAPLLVWFGMAALAALAVLIVSSVWRRRLRLSYEAWHLIHTVLGGARGLGPDVGGVHRPARVGPPGQAPEGPPVAAGAGDRRAGRDDDAGAQATVRVPLRAGAVRVVRDRPLAVRAHPASVLDRKSVV